MPIDVLAIEAAYKAGDIDALRSALGDPPDFPNNTNPDGLSDTCLEHAIYHSPPPFVRELIDLGADVNYADGAGFPSLIAALSSGRPDRYEIVDTLIAAGADVQQRGINGWTPLHYAASNNDVQEIEILLAAGADPSARTNIDDHETPLEEAERAGHKEAAEALRRLG